MNQYVKFITYVLLTCFFMAIMGTIVFYSLNLPQYILGWLWGIGMVLAYAVLLAVQSYKLDSEEAHAIAGRTGRNGLSRFILIASLALIGVQLPSIDNMTMGIAVGMMQVLMFFAYWRTVKE
ncbi:hypothetical protein [Veillonella agrestimuris]|uniref:hypothetical protein n=1 Tax=Veillonella agrestimuris TaxID=2941340 RepID=UPI00203F52B1|nr:hypothetical protein [Veillonella agrestimuris]